MIVLFLRKHWLPLACLLALAASLAWSYHKGRQGAQEAAERARVEAELAATQAALQDAQSAAEAAQAARDRNDEVVPRIRAESGARVDRAATADADQRVRDVQDALAGYGAASDSVRGTSAD